MRDFSKAKRIVIKIGTNILTKNDTVDAGYVRGVAGQVNSLLKAGRQVVIVSSDSYRNGTRPTRRRQGQRQQDAPGLCGYRPAASYGRVSQIVYALRRDSRTGTADLPGAR